MRPSPQPVLLDGNILVPLAYPPHVQHQTARQWFGQHTASFATCPIRQGTLVRMLLKFRAVPRTDDALAVLRGFVDHPRHCFWQDMLDYLHVDMKGVMGLCETVQVIDHGEVVAIGTPEQIQATPDVIEAYLGGG